MKNLVQEFAEIVIDSKTEVKSPNKFLLGFAGYVLARMLASKRVLAAHVVDVVVAMAAFSVRLVVNIASMFIRQYRRAYKSKKRRIAFFPIRVNDGVPSKLSHKLVFSWNGANL